ncbi:hypothetical protein E8E95_02340 [Pseudomonas sp. BN414]|uniref:hypothetical protein n=1 Tax=Pseudomonas sp. BN414 TaxID=2567888 RepID=UPI0024551AB7|nr:hypothetical protein [Pseudomonas sp. BN414]MDH4565517.1 hypothetical protein [Pseudomonas sp. BN414]
MTKTINPQDIFELSKFTGRSPSEILDIAQREGWEITDSAPIQSSQASSPQRTSVMNDPAGAVAMMRQLREETVKRLYQSDPGIREGIDAQMAIEASKGKKTIQSNFNYDEQGNLFGVKESVVTGANATVKNQTELMKEIKKNIYKQYGVTE